MFPFLTLNGIAGYTSGESTAVIEEVNCDPAHVPGSGKFEVEQSRTSRWNTVVGDQYSINRNWEILREAGFGARRSTFVSIGRRFWTKLPLGSLGWLASYLPGQRHPDAGRQSEYLTYT